MFPKLVRKQNFEGMWVNQEAIASGKYSEYYFYFFGNSVYLYAKESRGGWNGRPCNFIFTDTTITLISKEPNHFSGWTQEYTLQNNILILKGNGKRGEFHQYGQYTHTDQRPSWVK
jgi:hypothetical protein